MFYFRYNIRREKGLLRDPKTGIVGPNRKQIRYTELADEMVEKLGRLGQKSKNVSGSVFIFLDESLTPYKMLKHVTYIILGMV